MERAQLFQHFEALAETPGARKKIQQLVLDFAVRGRLTLQNPKEGTFDLGSAQSENDPDLKVPPSEEQPFSIPQNWIWGRFGQVFNIEGGTQPPKDQFVASPRDGYIHLLQIRDFGPRPVPTYIPKTDKLRVCATNDVMLARYGASVGKVLMGHEGAYNVALTKVIFDHSRLDVRFVFWWLQTSQFQKVLTGMSRSAQAGFNKGDLFPVPLPFPPLAEQRRIVVKVEELLALCDELEARQTATREHGTRFIRSALDHLAAAKDESEFRKYSAFVLKHSDFFLDSISTLRQAILSLAVQGRLVPRDSSKAIQESTMEDLVGKKNLKNGLSLKQTTGEARYSCLPISAMRDGLIRCSDRKPIVLTEERAKPYFIKANDVFIVRGNGSTHLVGRAGIVDGNPKDLIFPDLFIRVPLDGSRLDSRYFVLVWNSPEMRRRIESLAKTTAGILKINQGHIAALSVPVPPLSEQQRIVAKVNELMHWCDALETRLAATQTIATALLDAALHQILTRDAASAEMPIRRKSIDTEEYFAQLIPALLRAAHGNLTLERLNAAVALLFLPKILAPLVASLDDSAEAHFKAFNQPITESSFRSILRMLTQNRIVTFNLDDRAITLHLNEAEAPPIAPIISKDAQYLVAVLNLVPTLTTRETATQLCPPSLKKELLAIA